MSDVLTENEIRAKIRSGSRLVDAFVVTRIAEGGSSYVVYIHASWRETFALLRKHNRLDDRIYRDLDRLMGLLRFEYGFRGPVTTYLAGDLSLRGFPALAPPDAPDAQSFFNGDDTNNSRAKMTA